jgi:hypothetical protein
VLHALYREFLEGGNFGHKKAQKAQNKNGLNNKATKQQRGKGRGVFYANYANYANLT